LATKSHYNPVLNYFRESRSELKKVKWPAWKTVFKLSILVIIAAFAAGFAIGGVDYILAEILALLLR